MAFVDPAVSLQRLVLRFSLFATSGREAVFLFSDSSPALAKGSYPMTSLHAHETAGEPTRRERGESGLAPRRRAPAAVAALAMMTATAASANAAPSAQSKEATPHVVASAVTARPTGVPAAPAVPGMALARVNLRAAAAYAVKHVNDANQDEFNFKDNCTNFVSSVLVWGGGDPMTYGHPYQPGNSTNDHYWYFIGPFRYVLWSYSWSVAHDLYRHLSFSRADVSPTRETPSQAM